MNKQVLNVNDVCEILDRKPTYCYKVIRELNKELKDQGYYTNEGKVPAKYFYQRMGLDYEDISNE